MSTACTCECCTGSGLCGCCAGVRSVTPLPTWNRAGLSKLSYRVGTHATFFATMQTRLSSFEHPQLAALRTRQKDDPAIALLDAWSTVGDVLTFYQERIANEGYLRSATERRSVLELGRLIGYALRPGVAANAYLAYSIARDAEPVTIPAGAKVNSVPAPDEQMQTFETAEPLLARWEWNLLKPRQARPQVFAGKAPDTVEAIYLRGISTGIRTNDRVLLAGAGGVPAPFQVREVLPQPAPNPLDRNDRTRLTVDFLPAAFKLFALPARPVVALGAITSLVAPGARLLSVIGALGKPASIPPPHAARLPRALAATFAPTSDMLPRLLSNLAPALAPVLYAGLRNAVIAPADTTALHALRLKAAPFGHNAPMKPVFDQQGRMVRLEEWPIDGAATTRIELLVTHGDERMLRVSGSDGVDSYEWLLELRENGEQGTRWGEFTKVAVELADTRIAVRFSALATHDTVVHRNVAAGGAIMVNIDKAAFEMLPGQSIQKASGRDNIAIDRVTDLRAGTDSMARTVAALTPPPLNVLPLDFAYEQLIAGSWVLIERADKGKRLVTRVTDVQTITKTDYGMTGKSTVLTLEDNWLSASDVMLSAFRATTVYAQSEIVPLADEPLDDPVCGAEIELDGLFDGLAPGRWLIVAGERRDIKDADGVMLEGIEATERVMLAAVRQDVSRLPDAAGNPGKAPLPGDTTHTFLQLSTALAYCYRRDTMRIYGNVVNATHGETRYETLGAGAAAQPLQQFTLKQPPLTFTSAPTASGIASTLEIRVNDVAWREVDSLAASGPNARAFTTRTDDEGRTTAVFGNGEHGARLPTGQDNLKAVYRNGIGKGGNVKAGQLSLLNTRPLGVSEVVNPIRAAGGADKEGRDQARSNLPLALMALDRLVSTPDYAAFSRTFGGVGKAAAVRLADGRQQRVHVTIAGVDDIPIDAGSDLYHNLFDALHRFGDLHLPITLAVRERLALVLKANVRIDPDYRWEALEPKVRAALLDAFSFDHCDLDEDVLLADAISAVQAVAGVVYVDVDVFDTVSEADILAGFDGPIAVALTLRDRIAVAAARFDGRALLPAQLAYFSADLPDTLILQEIKP